VRRNAVTGIREIIKHEEQANKLNKHGGPAPLIKYISETSGEMRLPGIVALRHYAAVDQNNAKAIIDNKGILPLKDALVNDPALFVRTAAAWTIGEIARYSPDHAAPIVDAEIHDALLTVAKKIDRERMEEFWAAKNAEEQKKKMQEDKKNKKGNTQKEDTAKKETEDKKGEEEKVKTKGEEEQILRNNMRDDQKKRVFEALGKIIENCQKHEIMITIFLEGVSDIKNESTQQLVKVALNRLATLIRDRGDCWK
jgi:hypothetical protein